MVIKKFKEEICEGKRSQSSNFIYISMAEKKSTSGMKNKISVKNKIYLSKQRLRGSKLGETCS